MGPFKPLRFIRRWLRIAWENPLFWYNLLLIGVTAIAVWLWPAPIVDNTPSDFRIRLWGMALQIIGALTVWHDLTDSARNFGRPGFVANTLAWMKRLVSADAIAVGSISLPLQITVIGGGAKSRRDSPPRKGHLSKTG